MSFLRSGLLTSVIFASVIGCRSNDQASNGNATNSNSSATASFNEKTSPGDFLLGKWSRVDSEGGQYYLFAGDGFTATFDDPKKADRFEFPMPMRNGSDRFIGKWTVTESELVFTKISGPQVEKLIEEVRVSLKVLDGDAGIEIDGKTYKRGNFDDIGRSDDDEDDEDEDEDSSDSE